LADLDGAGCDREPIRRRLADFADLDKAAFDSYPEADGLPSDGVRAPFQDREGNVWWELPEIVSRKYNDASTKDVCVE
jgi:hypothetical protein